ncbi:hypothetical protein HWV62_18056 [Athelia sp. TMB]|nr:hypothetical protein HWV62_18056 [Athelia sp. TMB]
MLYRMPARETNKWPRRKVRPILSRLECGLILISYTRFILTDTEELHRKIQVMSQRIRQLEDALALLQSSISSEKHCLLRDDLLLIKYGPEQRPVIDDSEPSQDPTAEPIDAFGTLTIGDGGESRYFGASAGPEVCSLPTAREGR